MKKNLLLGLLVGLMVLVTGCGGRSYATLEEAWNSELGNSKVSVAEFETLRYIKDTIESYDDVDDESQVEAYLYFREQVLDGTWDDVDVHGYALERVVDEEAGTTEYVSMAVHTN